MVMRIRWLTHISMISRDQLVIHRWKTMADHHYLPQPPMTKHDLSIFIHQDQPIYTINHCHDHQLLLQPWLSIIILIVCHYKLDIVFLSHWFSHVHRNAGLKSQVQQVQSPTPPPCVPWWAKAQRGSTVVSLVLMIMDPGVPEGLIVWQVQHGLSLTFGNHWPGSDWLEMDNCL